MTNATRSVAVVATRLPTIDRRVLSQAWYSALHLAATPAGAPAPKQSPPVVQARLGTASAGRPAATRAQEARVAARRGASAEQRTAPVLGTAERRVPTTELSRRIERALVRHVPQAALPATIAIKAADGRIALLVRSEGMTTRVVALCAPHLRERVDRALAHARFALAASGTRIETAAS